MPLRCSAAFKDWNSFCCWRTQMQTTTLIIYVNKSTPLEMESSGAHAFRWFFPPPLLLKFNQTGCFQSIHSWAEHKATQSLTFIPAGRSDSSGLTLAFIPRPWEENETSLSHCKKMWRTPNNKKKKAKGIISPAEQQHPGAPASFSVVQPINKQNPAVLFIEDWCICIYTQTVEMWKLEFSHGTFIRHVFLAQMSLYLCRLC